MALLAIFKAMRHYWFLRRKRILNVSRDLGFLSLSFFYTDLVSTGFSHQKWLRSEVIYSKSPPQLRHAFWNSEHSSQWTVKVCLNHLFPFDTMQWISTLVFEGVHPESLLSARMEAENCCKDDNLCRYLEEESDAFCYCSWAHFHTNSVRQTSCPNLFFEKKCLQHDGSLAYGYHLQDIRSKHQYLEVFGSFSSEYLIEWMNIWFWHFRTPRVSTPLCFVCVTEWLGYMKLRLSF